MCLISARLRQALSIPSRTMGSAWEFPAPGEYSLMLAATGNWLTGSSTRAEVVA